MNTSLQEQKQMYLPMIISELQFLEDVIENRKKVCTLDEAKKFLFDELKTWEEYNKLVVEGQDVSEFVNNKKGFCSFYIEYYTNYRNDLIKLKEKIENWSGEQNFFSGLGERNEYVFFVISKLEV